ncbi:MAG: ribosomal protein S18-alanine N-acetyltransferase [Thermodesulfovibrio sp.]|nr:ribosomal protein S18-alanine N-acetyltransferase [Thermodesulfovibrio sp.]
MDEIIIRDFNESDITQVVNITEESFTIPWSVKSFLEESIRYKSLFKVAQFEKEIIGYIVVRVILDEAEILSLAVKSSFRKRGIASALLRDIIFNLKKTFVKTCYLEVRKSNIGAINLYKRFGFKECGIRKNYYIVPQEDAILMKLDL